MTEKAPEMLRRAAKAIDDYEGCARLYDPGTDEILDLYQLADAWDADIQKGANIATGLARQLRTAEARIEALEIEAATWLALAGPIWMGDESDGHFLCLACNQGGVDGGGTKTIPHLSDCEYAAALAKGEE